MTLGHRYQLEERVGAGGFSEVWRAEDLVLDRPVAVKVLHAGYAQDVVALARFRAEARHAGSLAHENIARVYDYDETHPPYLVMELVDGPSLAEVLASGTMDPVRVMDVIAQAASGLQAAHQVGLVHRDIKPGNLLLAPDGIVKITDFGISHAVGSAGVTSTGMVVGTAGYLAPERVTGGSATALSDLYSLGVVAYECLTGVPPFAGTALEVALAHANQPFPALPAFVPAAVGDLVARLVAKDPADRPGSAAEVASQARQLGDRPVSRSDLVAGLTNWLPASAYEPQTAGTAAMAVSRGHAKRLRRLAAMAGGAGLIAALVVIGADISGPASAGPASAGHPAAPAAVSSSSGAGHPASSTTRPKSAAIVAVDVNVDSLIGQPVSIVTRQLRQRGLMPRVVWQPSDQQQPGRVTAIWPTGQRPVGSLVTVVGALRAPAPADTSQPASQPKSSPNGNGNGNGNRNGKGNGKGKHKGNSKDNG